MNDLIDNFARILATPMPRRKAFKLFGGALAAVVVASVGVRPAEAACNKNQATCGTGGQCCNNNSCCYGTNNKTCCSGYLQGGVCLSKKPSSGKYTTCS